MISEIREFKEISVFIPIFVKFIKLLNWSVATSPLYRTDAKPRAEAACRLCRGAKEEDQRSKGVWGIGNTTKVVFSPPLY